MASSLSLSLCFLLLFHGCFAQLGPDPRVWPRPEGPERYQRDECQLQRLSALEPHRRIQSEAGITDIWDENDDQFQCAGVQVSRHTIQPRGLLLPQYVNGPSLVYVVQGRGVHGVMLPGCPETFQSSQTQHSQFSQSRSQSQRDQHQKVRQIREGDVVGLPTGVPHWIYNHGQSPLVLVTVVDTSNRNNQLDRNARSFFVAGNPQEELMSPQRGVYERVPGRRASERQDSFGNVFSGLDERLLAEAFNVNTDLAKKLRGDNDYRGIIVNVQRGLEVITPQQSPEEERHVREEERWGREFGTGSRGSGRYNGVEETFCTIRLQHNINDPSQADAFNPRAGRVTNVNSNNLPVLTRLQLSVQKGVLYRNAMMSPYWNVNAHGVHYFVRGSGQVQVVDDNGNTVFDGQVQEGQVLTAPQNYVVMKRASASGLEWVSFKTNDNARTSQLAGRVSAMRAMPVDVVANAYQVSRQEALRFKESRQEVTMLSPWSRSRYNITLGSD